MFSFPVLNNFNLFSDSKGELGNIVRLINDLKNRAVEQDSDFLLHIDTASGTLLVTNDAMDDKELAAAKEKSVQLTEGLSVLDVEFPGLRQTDDFECQIRFRREGYSDFALIHFIKDGKNMTLKIEPFLSQVQLIDRHVGFSD